MIKQIAVPRRLSPAEDYLRLVRRFPLRPLRNTKEYDIAASVLDELVLCDNLSKGESDYLDALSTFVETYDDKHFPIDTSHLKPLDTLRFLMEQNEMTSTDLGKLLGSRSAASMILSGKRELSKTHIRKLAARFSWMPACFFDQTRNSCLPRPPVARGLIYLDSSHTLTGLKTLGIGKIHL